jgi:thiol-disulfide isomerase/thioredoxin
MKILLFILTGLFIKNVSSQQVELLSFSVLNERVQSVNDTLYVVNFWATWCKPCIEELPVFEKCNKEYRNKKVKIILANLDFNSKVESLVLPFIKSKNIQTEVVHITDTDANQWINNVDTSWSGAIPATVIYRKGKKIFFKEGIVSENEINGILSETGK